MTRPEGSNTPIGEKISGKRTPTKMTEYNIPHLAVGGFNPILYTTIDGNPFRKSVRQWGGTEVGC